MSDERRCLVVDDHQVVRLGVRELLDDHYHIDEAEDAEGAIRLLNDVGNFDVVIVDTGRMGTANGRLAGTAVIKALLKAQPGLGIVAHGDRPERHIAAEALRAGARAFVAKSSPAKELSRAVDAAADAGTFIDPAAAPQPAERVRSLTRRQREILQLVADGHSTARIAHGLGLSEETIRTHTKAVLARLEARDRAHAVAISLRAGLIE